MHYSTAPNCLLYGARPIRPRRRNILCSPYARSRLLHQRSSRQDAIQHLRGHHHHAPRRTCEHSHTIRLDITMCIVLVGFKVLHVPSASPCCESANECHGHMRVHAPTRALAVQTLVLHWRSGTAPPCSISPISTTPLASLARGLCCNFNLEDAHAPLSPPPAQEPASPTFSQINHFIIATLSGRMDAVRDRIFTRVSPARENRGEHDRKPSAARRTIRSLGICRLCSLCCAALRFSRRAAFALAPDA